MEWRPGRMTVGPPWFGAAALVVANGTDGCHVLYYLDNCQALITGALWSTTLQTQLGAYFG